MSEANINILFILALVWTLALSPLVLLHGIKQFMDLMRRKHDDQPW